MTTTERFETDREFFLREAREWNRFYVASLTSEEVRDTLVEERDGLVEERAGIRAHVRSLRESEARDALVEHLGSQAEAAWNRYNAEWNRRSAAANGS